MKLIKRGNLLIVFAVVYVLLIFVLAEIANYNYNCYKETLEVSNLMGYLFFDCLCKVYPVFGIGLFLFDITSGMRMAWKTVLYKLALILLLVMRVLMSIPEAYRDYHNSDNTMPILLNLCRNARNDTIEETIKINTRKLEVEYREGSYDKNYCVIYINDGEYVIPLLESQATYISSILKEALVKGLSYDIEITKALNRVVAFEGIKLCDYDANKCQEKIQEKNDSICTIKKLEENQFMIEMVDESIPLKELSVSYYDSSGELIAQVAVKDFDEVYGFKNLPTGVAYASITYGARTQIGGRIFKTGNGTN